MVLLQCSQLAFICSCKELLCFNLIHDGIISESAPAETDHLRYFNTTWLRLVWFTYLRTCISQQVEKLQQTACGHVPPFPPPLSFLRDWVRWYHSGSHPRQACGQRHPCTPPPSKEKSFTHPRKHVPNSVSARGWLVQKVILCTSVWTTFTMWAVSAHKLNTH